MNTLPSTKEMVTQFAESAKDVIAQLASKGIIKASDEKVESRLDICRQCEFYVIDQHRCSKCGCHMKAKVWFDGVKCPVDKW